MYEKRLVAAEHAMFKFHDLKVNDVWIGRYRAITVGIGLCFCSWIIGGGGFYFTLNLFMMQGYSSGSFMALHI